MDSGGCRMYRLNEVGGLTLIPPERIDRLQADFFRLLGLYRASVTPTYELFDRLVVAYSEPHRHYHNLEHIVEMFRVVDRLSHQLLDLRPLRLAVWFHDAVYDPRASDNEERSADLARESLIPLGLPANDIEAIRRMILATRHHPTHPVNSDTAVLLDADLAILGASEARYRRYADAIRKEYDFVADADYIVGRIRVLETFLARERIYTHEILHEEGQPAAKRNLIAEIERLRSGEVT